MVADQPRKFAECPGCGAEGMFSLLAMDDPSLHEARLEYFCPSCRTGADEQTRWWETFRWVQDDQPDPA